MGIHPEWYFMSPFEMLKLLGSVLPGAAGEIAGILLFTIGIVLWVLIPFYDTKQRLWKTWTQRALFWPDRGDCAAGNDGNWVLER